MTAVDRRRVAPAQYVASHDALSQLPDLVADLGGRAALVHGQVGLGAAETVAGSLLPDAVRVPHRGYCTRRRVSAIAEELRRRKVDVVVAVGGGKVLDVGKAAAQEAGLKIVTVPTSPATCAAMTPLSVIYREDGGWDHGMALPSCPDAALLDLGLLERAPSRLLASGVLDALAKMHEVRLSLRRVDTLSPTEEAAASLCSALEGRIDLAALQPIFRSREDQTMSPAPLAEAVVAYPGWIGGFAGEASKIAAAHAVHNGFTRLVSTGSVLHGELVGFGLVVQELLEESDPEGVVEVARILDAPLGLAAMGYGAYLSSEDARVAVDAAIEGAPSFKKAFPNAGKDLVREAVLAADQLLVAATANA